MSDPAIDALILEASVLNEADPLERFVGILGGEMQRQARDTIRMRNELLSCVQQMFATKDPREAVAFAARVRSNAIEVAHRWAVLCAAAAHWASLEAPPFRAIVRGTPDRKCSP